MKTPSSPSFVAKELLNIGLSEVIIGLTIQKVSANFVQRHLS
jgi:hypothetical protein